MQDDHRAMVDGEASEPALELIPIVDRVEPGRRRRLIGRQQTEGSPPNGASCEPRRSRRARGADTTRLQSGPGRAAAEDPATSEFLLVAPSTRSVAQDPERHRMEPIASGHGQAREGLSSPFCARDTRARSLGSSARWRRFGLALTLYGAPAGLRLILPGRCPMTRGPLRSRMCWRDSQRPAARLPALTSGA